MLLEGSASEVLTVPARPNTETADPELWEAEVRSLAGDRAIVGGNVLATGLERLTRCRDRGNATLVIVRTNAGLGEGEGHSQLAGSGNDELLRIEFRSRIRHD